MEGQATSSPRRRGNALDCYATPSLRRGCVNEGPLHRMRRCTCDVDAGGMVGWPSRTHTAQGQSEHEKEGQSRVADDKPRTGLVGCQGVGRPGDPLCLPWTSCAVERRSAPVFLWICLEPPAWTGSVAAVHHENGGAQRPSLKSGVWRWLVMRSVEGWDRGRATTIKSSSGSGPSRPAAGIQGI
jgi:hypothetical protein